MYPNFFTRSRFRCASIPWTDETSTSMDQKKSSGHITMVQIHAGLVTAAASSMAHTCPGPFANLDLQSVQILVPGHDVAASCIYQTTEAVRGNEGNVSA